MALNLSCKKTRNSDGSWTITFTLGGDLVKGAVYSIHYKLGAEGYGWTHWETRWDLNFTPFGVSPDAAAQLDYIDFYALAPDFGVKSNIVRVNLTTEGPGNGKMCLLTAMGLAPLLLTWIRNAVRPLLPLWVTKGYYSLSFWMLNKG